MSIDYLAQIRCDHTESVSLRCLSRMRIFDSTDIFSGHPLGLTPPTRDAVLTKLGRRGWAAIDDPSEAPTRTYCPEHKNIYLRVERMKKEAQEKAERDLKESADYNLAHAHRNAAQALQEMDEELTGEQPRPPTPDPTVTDMSSAALRPGEDPSALDKIIWDELPTVPSPAEQVDEMSERAAENAAKIEQAAAAETPEDLDVAEDTETEGRAERLAHYGRLVEEVLDDARTAQVIESDAGSVTIRRGHYRMTLDEFARQGDQINAQAAEIERLKARIAKLEGGPTGSWGDR